MTDFIQPLPRIDGAFTVQLRAIGDDRGRFMETFRLEWFPQVSWDRLQSNRSESRAGVLRGLHYHFRQVDYWTAQQGQLRAALVDLRPGSPTYLNSTTVDMGEKNPIGLFIPIGVAHGFAALTDCALVYVVNNYYDGTDEFGMAWDDPQFNLDWGVAEPLISGRDASNPRLVDIPAEHLPR